MERQAERFINEAKKGLEDCKEEGSFAKARGLLVEKACESEDFAAVVVTPEEQQGFELVANNLEQELQKNTKEAQKDFYMVKDKSIGLKTEIVKSKFQKMQSSFQEEVKKLESELREECEKLKETMKKMEGKINAAKKNKDKNLEEELKTEFEMLNDKSEALVDEFEQFKEMEPIRIKNDFEFAMGALHVEAANTFEDYMEAFAVLVKKALQLHLKRDVKFRACFEKVPKVEVAVDKLTDKGDLIKLSSCPEDVE